MEFVVCGVELHVNTTKHMHRRRKFRRCEHLQSPDRMLETAFLCSHPSAPFTTPGYRLTLLSARGGGGEREVGKNHFLWMRVSCLHARCAACLIFNDLPKSQSQKKEKKQIDFSSSLKASAHSPFTFQEHHSSRKVLHFASCGSLSTHNLNLPYAALLPVFQFL